MREKTALRPGDAVEAYSAEDGAWLPAVLVDIGRLGPESCTIRWEEGQTEVELELLDVRHCRCALSKKERLFVREERLARLRKMLPLAVEDLHDPTDVYMVWRTFRVADGIALGVDDPDFLEGKAACVANSSDVCHLALEERVGEPMPLHKLAGAHAQTFGVGTSKYLGTSFKDFVKSHFDYDDHSKMVLPFGDLEEARAAKRRKLDSDKQLGSALVEYLKSVGGTGKIGKDLLRFPAVADALSDATSRTEQGDRVRNFVRSDSRFDVSKSGSTMKLVWGQLVGRGGW